VKPSNPSRLFNRELSWLFFNTRVLEEAENPDVPLLERVRFLSISASNLDEFYMVRVAGLRQQMRAGLQDKTSSHLRPAEQLRKIDRRAGKIVARQNQCWLNLRQELAALKINVLKNTFATTILPLLTPLAVDPTHPFPFLPNLGFGIVLGLKQDDRDPLFGLMTVPLTVPRMIEIQSSGKSRNFVSIEDVLQAFASDIYLDFDVTASAVFRITRDSGIAIDEGADK